MTEPTPERAFELRHLQLMRALFAAIAAVMITFTGDHSAAVGLSVFSGFAVASSLVFGLSAWLVFPAGRRMPAVLLAAVSLLAGLFGGVPTLRSVTLFFVLVIAWAVISGLIELLFGIREWRAHRSLAGPRRVEARDAIVVGSLGLLLALGLAFVSPQYSLDYAVKGDAFTLTGITIAVGIFGGYAAIVAVFLAIAGFSPKVPAASSATNEVGKA